MLNWIVLGIGDISTRRVIPAIQAEPRSRLYGIVTRDPAKAAPYHSKHVLCEKPMAMNEAEDRAIVETAEQTGRTLGVAYYRRHYPKAQRAKQLLAANAIGKPVIAELTAMDGSTAKNMTAPTASVIGWWIPLRAGGGPLFDIASPHRRAQLSLRPAGSRVGTSLKRRASLRRRR